MLAYTQGLLPTDNFEFLADFKADAGLSFITEITGLTAGPLQKDVLAKGDALRYELEPENAYDKYAVKLFFKDNYLGHVKLIHSRVFHNSNRILPVRVHSIESAGVLMQVFVKVGG
ncbi:MAG: hypothetical protein H7296_07365 [Bacteroidia bacterium]|nr:hypothetical protein [Bacteroidia bacterium]